jgi:amino acid permease
MKPIGKQRDGVYHAICFLFLFFIPVFHLSCCGKSASLGVSRVLSVVFLPLLVVVGVGKCGLNPLGPIEQVLYGINE